MAVEYDVDFLSTMNLLSMVFHHQITFLSKETFLILYLHRYLCMNKNQNKIQIYRLCFFFFRYIIYTFSACVKSYVSFVRGQITLPLLRAAIA